MSGVQVHFDGQWFGGGDAVSQSVAGSRSGAVGGMRRDDRVDRQFRLVGGVARQPDDRLL